MRRPVPIESPASPADGSPSPAFITDLLAAIRQGVKPQRAAKQLGVPAQTWHRWMDQKDEPYATMRTRISAAITHHEDKLLAGIDESQRPNFESPDARRLLARQQKQTPWQALGLTYAQEQFC